MFSKPWHALLSVSGAFLLYFCLASLAHAAGSTYYVSPAGSDANSGSLAQPFRTITHGVGVLAAGDTLFIRAGTYVEAVSFFNKLGTASQPIIISGYPGERPVIKPPASVIEGTVAIGVDASDWVDSYITVKDLDIDGSNMPNNSHCLGFFVNRNTADNIYCLNAPRNGFEMFGYDNVIRHSTVKNCGRLQPPTEGDVKGIGVYINHAGNIFEHNVIDGCRAGGIVVQVSPVSNNIIRYNTVKNGGLYSPWPAPTSGPIAGHRSATGINIGYADAVGNLVYNNVFSYLGSDTGDAPCVLFWQGAGRQGANYFYNNTCHVVDIGIWMVESSSNNHIRNNIFSSVKTQQDICPACANNIISNNLWNPLQ